MAESKYVTLGAGAQTVNITAFGELDVDYRGRVSINGHDIEDVISKHLALESDDSGRSYSPRKTTLATIQITVIPYVADDVKIKVNGQVYPAPESENQTESDPAKEEFTQ